MPFDDLTEAQQSFILKYFKSGGFRKKTKAKYEEFNGRLEQALTPLYDKINDVQALLNRLEAAEADAPEDGPKLPIDMYQTVLNDLGAEIEQTLSKNRNQLKAGLVPDFSATDRELDALKTRLEQQFERIHSGARADTLTDNEKLRTAKEHATSTAHDQLGAHYAVTADAFGTARGKMAAARLENIAERDAKYMAYGNLHSEAIAALNILLREQGSDPVVDLDTYTVRCAHHVEAFTGPGDVLRARIIELGNAPLLTQDDLTAIKAQAEFRMTDTVQISEQRAEGIAAALATLNNSEGEDGEEIPGALQSQTKKLEDLRTAYREADESERDALRKQFEAQQAHVEKLQIRKAQLEAYAAQELARDRQIVATIETARTAKTQADALAQALSDDTTDLATLDFPWLDSPSYGEDSIALAAKIIEHRQVVEASAARDLVVIKLTPEEPTPKEISQLESRILLTMLDNAEALIDEGRGDIAEKLFFEVIRLRREFMAARLALQLPPATQAPPTRAKALVNALGFIRSDANDLWGQGVDAAGDLAKDAMRLIETVKADDEAGKFIADPDLHQAAVDDLRDQVAALASSAAPSAIADDKVAAATATANEISEFLNGALKTEPLKDTDIVRELGVAYPEATEKHLVSREDLIMVDVDGVMVQHKIASSVKKGGVETASTRSSNKVPVEVLEAMVARNHAMRAMTQADTPGAEAMLEAYEIEAKEWFEDVKDHGATVYPDLAKLISDCDKIMNKGALATYIPDAYPEFKNRYTAFKDGYLKKKPTEAMTEGTALKGELDALETHAAGTVKTDYETGKGIYDKLLATLTGKEKRGDPPTIGKFIEDFLAKSPEEVFGDVSDLSEQGAADVAKARSTFDSLKAHYAKATVFISPKTVEGPWLNNAKSELKLLESKIEANITDANEKLREIETEVDAYFKSLTDMAQLTGDALAAQISKLCADIVKTTVAATDAHNKGVAFRKALTAITTEVGATQKAAKKLGKNPVAQDLKSQADGLESRCKAAKTTAEGNEDFDSGMAEVEKITRELETIKTNLADLDPSSYVPVKKYRIADRLSSLQSVMDKFTARASELAAKDIRPQMSDAEKTALMQDVSIIDVSLKKNTNVVSIAALKTITDEIDTKNNDETKSWKAERMALREKALKEMRSIRAKLDTHPSAQLYASNPFDGGVNMRLVKSALHHVEIAILASVSPKDPD